MCFLNNYIYFKNIYIYIKNFKNHPIKKTYFFQKKNYLNSIF